MNFYFHTHSLTLATHKAVPLIKRGTQSPSQMEINCEARPGLAITADGHDNLRKRGGSRRRDNQIGKGMHKMGG